VVVGAGLAVLAFLALAVGLLQVLPETQPVVHATRDLDVGHVVQLDDVAVAQVRLPSELASATIGDTDQVVGRRLEAPVKAGQLMASDQFAAHHASVAEGRVQPTIPVESYTASGGQLAAGDMVMVYGTPHQATGGDGSADVLIDAARVVDVRPDTSGNTLSGTSRPLLLTLDVTREEGARLVYASHEDALDVVVVGGNGVDQ
jgi:Flp pilus assembly protein CpaB